MFDPKILEDFGNRMSTLLANSPARDIEKNAKAMVSGLIGKLDVVTREEFDVQAELLRRTRERLQQLEARVEALEQAQSAARAGNSEHA
ncbi:MAG TPA: accessory factor UbiK family protein [Rhodocyclaceae bacterium]|nr:accessory factor UbiK family protein [Rhodocyclaceae bacterium]